MTNPYAMSANMNPYAAAYQQNNYSPNYSGNVPISGIPSNDMYQSGGRALYPAKSNGPSTIGMMSLGALGGGLVGYFKNRYPVGKDGNVSDSFAKEVFEKNLKKNRPESSQKYFKQLQNILKKIDKVSTPEEFKTLLNENKGIIEEQCKGISSDTLLNAVNSTNLKDSKKSLKEALEGIMNFEITKTKNAIKLGWNSESKKFVKTSEFKDSKLFKIIKNTKNSGQWKKALKYGGITAGILGALTIGYKMLMPSKRA